MRLKIPSIVRVLSWTNAPFVRFVLAPIILALAIAVLPPLHRLDTSLRQAKISSAMRLNPDPDIVLITLDRDDYENSKVHSAGGESIFNQGPAYSWRETHGRLIQTLVNLPIPPRTIGIDISFIEKEQQKYDRHIQEAVAIAKKRGVPLVFSANPQIGTSLNEKHWIVKAFRDGSVDLGTTRASSYQSSDVLKSFELHHGSFTRLQGVQASLPLLLHLRATNASISTDDVERFPEVIPLRFVQNPFKTYHYRDVFDPERFASISSQFERRIVLVGVETEDDMPAFPFVTEGQLSAPDAETGIVRSYGVYVLANVINNLQQYDSPAEIEGLAKIVLLILAILILTATLHLMHRMRLMIRIIGVAAVDLLMIVIALSAKGTIAPVASLALVLVCGSIFLLTPDIYLVRLVAKTKGYVTSYEYMNRIAFIDSCRLLAIPCRAVADVDHYVDALNKAFVEASGHTWFEEIPVSRLKSQSILEDNYELSRKRPDCIARADFLKESFIGTRIRRLRNLYSHAGLSEHLIRMARESIAHYTGLRLSAARAGDPEPAVEFALSGATAFRLQSGLLTDLNNYLKAFLRTES